MARSARPEPEARWLGLGPTAVLQLFHIGKVGANLLASILLARMAYSRDMLAPYETMMLAHAAATFAVVTGLTSHFLAAYSGAVTLRRERLLRNAATLAFLAGAAAGILVLAYGWAVLPGWRQGVLAMAGFTFCTLATLLLEYRLWIEGRFTAMALIGGMTVAGQMAAIVLPIAFGAGFPVVFRLLFLLGVARLLVAIYHFGPLFRPPRSARSKRLFWWQWRKAWPLISLSLVGGSAAYIDGLLVEAWAVPGDFVLFRYGSRELPLTLVLANGLSAATVALLSRAAGTAAQAEALIRLRQQSLRLMHIAFPITMTLLVISPLLYRWVYGEAYVPAFPIFNIYLLLVVPRMLFPQSILTARQRSKVLLRVSLAEWLIHVGLALPFFWLWGLQGIAWAAVVSYCAEKALLAWQVRRLRLAPVQYVPWRWWLGYSLAAAGLFVAVQFFG